MRKRRGSDFTAETVQALAKALEQGGGRREASASRGPVGEFLLRSFYMVDLPELICGIQCREAAASRVRDPMPREGARGPLGRGRKSRRGGSGPGIGARFGGRVQVIAVALQGEVGLAVGGQDREAMGGELPGETPSPA